ncbi:MAG: hypothetical protein K0M49_11100 [Arenimonas sp.]|nr:hypothetical protein [Arenimonas sp.]
MPIPSSLSIAGKPLYSLLVVSTTEEVGQSPPAAGALVVSPGGSTADWRAAALFLTRRRQTKSETPLLVLVDSALDSDALDERLEILVPARPDGIVLSSVADGSDLQRLDVALSVAEAMAGREPGATPLIAMIGDNASGLLALASFAGRTPRLRAVGRAARALAAELRMEGSPNQQGDAAPVTLSRGLTLLGAAKAQVAALDWLDPTLTGHDLERACAAARRDGFSALITETPDQLTAIAAAYG